MIPLSVPVELRIADAQRSRVENPEEKVFTLKLADTIAQAWVFLPYRMVTRLHFRLFGNGSDFIGSVSSGDDANATYRTGTAKDRYLHLVPQSWFHLEKESLVYEGRAFALVGAWGTGSPAID